MFEETKCYYTFLLHFVYNKRNILQPLNTFDFFSVAGKRPYPYPCYM